MAKPKVLNWYKNEKKLFEKLLRLYKSKEEGASFITIRLGPKWADALNPDELVAISISNDPKKPKIIGFARVNYVKKTTFAHLLVNSGELSKNVGAKKWKQVWEDMKKIYGRDELSPLTPISIIHLSIST